MGVNSTSESVVRDLAVGEGPRLMARGFQPVLSQHGIDPAESPPRATRTTASANFPAKITLPIAHSVTNWFAGVDMEGPGYRCLPSQSEQLFSV